MITITQILQITDAHCGPAVLEMLLLTAGVAADQNLITQAAGAEATIQKDGVTVEQLAQATKKLAPHLRFWYKYQATLDDVRWVMGQGYGAGVQWQGLFYESVAEEEAEEGKYFDDRGHYCIVNQVDDERGEVELVNPHSIFAGRNQRLPIPVFMRRWWDFNEVENPITEKRERVIDERLLFLVAPYEDFIHPKLGFRTLGA